MFKIGDLVTRKSHNNDIVFEIIDIDEDDIFYLKGVNVRLYVDAYKDDLVEVKSNEENDNDEKELLSRIKNNFKLDRNDYFYLPGKILHIDCDNDYLNRCLEYYKKVGVYAIGKKMEENQISESILELIKLYTPSIIVITGHDAYYKGNIHDMSSYKNSKYFVDAIKVAREYEMSHEKLIIIAGACQSNYEELIKAGANFASSPKRTNIHALDPAVIASYMALYDSGKDIDIKKVLENTKYGSDGMGGIITKGTMYIGYPR